MRILHVITGLDVGGAETTLHRLTATMDPVRFRCRVVSLVAPGEMGRRLADAGVEVASLSMRRGVPSPAGLARLAGMMRSYRPHVVQTWLYHADLLGLAARALAFPLGASPRLVWNIRCAFMDLDRYPRTTALTLRACAALSRFPDATVTNSAAARDFHRGLGYSPRRFEIIPNGFDADRFRPDAEARTAVRAELGLGADDLVIGHAARFDPMKDHHTLLLAAGMASQELPDAVFVLAGRGVDSDNQRLAAWLAEAGFDSRPGIRGARRVRLLGERHDLERVMAAMDMHVSSSAGESLPNVVGEAMACGVPSVVTDVGDSAALVGNTGEVVPPGDAQALARAMVRMAGLGRLGRDALGLSARERVVAGFSPAAAARRYEALYTALCAGPEKSFP
ncbi:glycosyltransferase [Pseudodesulfovibrio sp. F-1]|uniref:Glycosyltransferase n=1 Tax=Pseudodesulfovibrio alkaliphilus TaxID=2661613 RepID=A0A7K1KN15_9BACT|nr:glycosyltransferase [Pseudodesulfovibrio alkaliphilus]MUM77272.1 glycosyltransferase [Pseudodesulfovibrio alkaliphilus]